MQVIPIRTEKDYQAAMERIDELWGAPIGSTEGDELEVLATLVEAYEAKHYPIDPPEPVEAIKFRMEQQGLSDADLVPYLGQRSRVTEVLQKKRGLSIAMIRRLHKGLSIPLESLIGEYPLLKS